MPSIMKWVNAGSGCLLSCASNDAKDNGVVILHIAGGRGGGDGLTYFAMVRRSAE